MDEKRRVNINELNKILAKHFGFDRCHIMEVRTGLPIEVHDTGPGRLLTVHFELSKFGDDI